LPPIAQSQKVPKCDKFVPGAECGRMAYERKGELIIGNEFDYVPGVWLVGCSDFTFSEVVILSRYFTGMIQRLD
jgi:hypothetical protein